LIPIVRDFNDHDAILISQLTSGDKDDKAYVIAYTFVDLHNARNFRDIPCKKERTGA